MMGSNPHLFNYTEKIMKKLKIVVDILNHIVYNKDS